MVLLKKWSFLTFSCFVLGGSIVLGAQTPVDDPVMKARADRAQAQGISEGDLPPVPRGIVEPPPRLPKVPGPPRAPPPPQVNIRPKVAANPARG